MIYMGCMHALSFASPPIGAIPQHNIVFVLWPCRDTSGANIIWLLSTGGRACFISIYLVGFSMGGCLALELLGSELFAGRLAGVFSHASFLSDDSAV